MKPTAYYISQNEGLTNVRERLEHATARSIALVIPANTKLCSHVAWRLLHSRAGELSKEVLVISPDHQIRAVAKAAGFRVTQPLESLSASRSRPGSRPDQAGFGPRTPVLNHKVLGNLPMPVQHVIAAVLTRAGDPEPEVTHASRQKVVEMQAMTWGWLPHLALTSAMGVFTVSYAYNTARNGATGANIFFWFGLLLIFVPPLGRLISPAASRFERMGLLCVVGICFYLVKVMLSPLYFSEYDEFLHWRTADDIARSGHLFRENALLPVSPLYPGLEIVTNAFSKLSGLSTFNAGVVVAGVARLVMILSLFMLNEQITGSARIAGIATILYMTNPHFLFFDALFSYESLALPLATFVLFAMARHEALDSGRHWMTLTAWIVLAAVVVTHHLTDFIFDGLFILWAVLYALLRPASLRQSDLARTALLGVFMSVASIILIAYPVVQYISSSGSDILSQLGRVLGDSSGARHLFVGYGDQPTPLSERAMTLSSVALISLSLPFGLLCIWRRYRYNALACMLGIVSLSYPIIQLLRVTDSGAELSDRALAFLFIPIACVLAIFITQFWPTRHLNWRRIVLITCAISIVFMGNITLGSGPARSILPGPYLVASDARSIEARGIQSAIWVRSYLGPDNRVATDRINQLLMSTYGDQHLVTASGDNIDVTDVFFSPSLGHYEISLLRRAKVRYLVVDLRLNRALPEVGFYFEQGEPNSFERTTPIDLEALTKFNTIPQINRVFDGGDIVIYDLGGIISAPEKP